MPSSSTNTERITQPSADLHAQQQTEAPRRAAPAATSPMTDEQRRAAIEAELMENRPHAPEVAQPLGGRRIRIVTRTLNGDQRVSAQLFEVPGYKGPQLAVAEYKSSLGQGYRVYLAKTGMFLDDNNGVGTLNDVLTGAVQRVRNARARVAAERLPAASPAAQDITDDNFAALAWPAQSQVLRKLNDLSCAQEGRTYGEAQRKRAPIDKRMQELQTIHDKQRRDWISAAGNGSPLAQSSAVGEIGPMHDDAVDDEAQDAPGMR